MSEASLLSVRGLSVDYPGPDGDHRALDRVYFSVDAHRCLAVVGESGSGKSSLVLALMGLLPRFSETDGAALYKGQEISTLDEKAFRKIRGSEIGVVFQDPHAALNPLMQVGHQIAEALRGDGEMSAKASFSAAIDLLQRVGIASPDKRAKDYPHQLSGGICQRVMIAIALAGNPRLLLADEPTSALDASVRGQILGLLGQLKDEGLAIILATHDFSSVAQISDDLLVLYAGRMVERGPTETILRNPRHPYTAALIGSLPQFGGQPIPSVTVDPRKRFGGCRFSERCAYSQEHCRVEEPHSQDVGERHRIRCWYPLQEAAR
jgi:oligopeptide/dipeptide ABC transporter ATP-binding protein